MGDEVVVLDCAMATHAEANANINRRKKIKQDEPKSQFLWGGGGVWPAPNQTRT